MRVMLIGSDVKVQELVEMAVRLRCPEAPTMGAVTVREGLELIKWEYPDAVLLHSPLPEWRLADAVSEIRKHTDAPLLVLGQGEEEVDMVTAINAGADDYLKLPCDLADLSLRVWVSVRRTRKTSQNNVNLWKFGPLVINPDNYTVTVEGNWIALTPTEFRLLHLLTKHSGQVLHHFTIEEALWGRRANCSRLVRKYIQRLRCKLGDDAIEPKWIASVHGVGYRFIGPPNPTSLGDLTTPPTSSRQSIP